MAGSNRADHPPAQDESIPDDLATLQARFPGWRFGTVWTSAASGPDRRRLTAIRDGIILSAWDAAALAAAIDHEGRGND